MTNIFYFVYDEWSLKVRYIAESLTFLMCILNLVIQGKELYGQGIKEYIKNLLGEPANVFYNIFCVLVILAFPFRFVDTGNPQVTAKNVEDTFVILAVPCAWMHMLLYARLLIISLILILKSRVFALQKESLSLPQAILQKKKSF